MWRENVVTISCHRSRVLPRRRGRRPALLPAVLTFSLLCAAVGLAAGGEGPVPIVEVKLSEYAVEMPLTIPIGPAAFSVTNAGTTAHNFEVEGQGLEKKFETTLKPGETRTLEVDLPAGTYLVYCPVDDHKARGMQLELKVAQQQSR